MSNTTVNTTDDEHELGRRMSISDAMPLIENITALITTAGYTVPFDAIIAFLSEALLNEEAEVTA